MVFFLSVGLLEEAIFTLVERGGYLYFTKEACSLRRLEAGGYLYRGRKCPRQNKRRKMDC